MTAAELIATEGKHCWVRCVRACIGCVGGHVRATRGERAVFTHPNGIVYDVYRCKNCGAYWKQRAPRPPSLPESRSVWSSEAGTFVVEGE